MTRAATDRQANFHPLMLAAGVLCWEDLRSEVSLVEWAIDSSGLRAAHRCGALGSVHSACRLHVSPLTWLSTPEARGAAVIEPVLRFPWLHDGIAPFHSEVPDSEAGGPLRLEALCEHLEELHVSGVLVVATERHDCDPARVAEVEGMWHQAGMVGPPTEETISAVLVAEHERLPLVCDDVSARRLARQCGVETITIEDFALSVAA